MLLPLCLSLECFVSSVLKLNLLNCCNTCSTAEGKSLWVAGELGRKWKHIFRAVLLPRCSHGGDTVLVPADAYCGLTSRGALMTMANDAPVIGIYKGVLFITCNIASYCSISSSLAIHTFQTALSNLSESSVQSCPCHYFLEAVIQKKRGTITKHIYLLCPS